MAYSCVDAVKQSVHCPVGRRLVELLPDGRQSITTRPSHVKSLIFIEDFRVQRDCSYLPTGTLRRLLSKKFVPRRFARGLRRSRVLWQWRAPLLASRRGLRFQIRGPVQHHVDLPERLLGGLE